MFHEIESSEKFIHNWACRKENPWGDSQSNKEHPLAWGQDRWLQGTRWELERPCWRAQENPPLLALQKQHGSLPSPKTLSENSASYTDLGSNFTPSVCTGTPSYGILTRGLMQPQSADDESLRDPSWAHTELRYTVCLTRQGIWRFPQEENSPLKLRLSLQKKTQEQNP